MNNRKAGFDEKATEEEAAKRFPNGRTKLGIVRTNSPYRSRFIEGARWQHSQDSQRFEELLKRVEAEVRKFHPENFNYDEESEEQGQSAKKALELIREWRDLK